MRASSVTRNTYVIIVAVAIFTGCSHTQPDEQPYSSYVSGAVQVGLRELRYNLFGGGEVTTTGDPAVATINFLRGGLTLDDTQVLLDNGDSVSLPEKASIVRVYYTDGLLRIAADGKRIYSGRFPESTE